MAAKRNPLSVAIITLNEEKNLPDCLASVSFADEIVIVDSGSRDRTLNIARDFGCRIFVENWKGYGHQKNSAVEKCTYDWVLLIDADERIPPETRERIVDVLKSPTADAFIFQRKNFFYGKWIRHGGWWPDYVLRLFRKDRAKISNRNVHESVEVNGVIEKLNVPIIHNPIENVEEIISKINFYSSLGAKDLQRAGCSPSISKAVAHSLAIFLKTYLVKQGFRDGKEGLIIAFSSAVNTFYKYIKLWELVYYAKRGADEPE
ncbi:MAG: glycosyltransferase family 2 protein [Thermodesulfovibrio sp.]|uniref:glycosyltransferase family 2 protein n=1 Tax=unclassified Thermodesulfovibrio TaxID=2645936 RepID=UPI000839EDD5|nr:MULTISPECIES: glycosyltransferase family 2 protein [unclassified Thermodesulfovibrio]MDI1471843.1 glycosyltransferase family 2 protein [Thermodesulfovibrio sp. 1176]MDI6713733.1 glycosyltransferase family 2 protein [Thermodesulfovibrio sp.]ODA44832.1 Beta 1,4 glucosyltransferase [Thermodesulfovibrio sp. N1]